MRHDVRPLARKGFTLIELMVVMALTMFVMMIMTQAFVLALEVFSGLKGIGDMQENLRVAANALRADLSADHFDGKRRLSDDSMMPNAAMGTPAVRPTEGFFAIYQGGGSVLDDPSYGYTPPYGTDADNVPSYYATNHVLHMSVKRKGNRPDGFFPTNVTDPTFFANAPYLTLSGKELQDFTFTTTATGFASPWGETLYFLEQSGSTLEPNNPKSTLGKPLYSLYRAQFVVPPNTASLNTATFASITDDAKFMQAYSGIAANYVAAKLEFYSPNELATGKRTLDAAAINPNRLRTATNKGLLLANVLSFQVQVLRRDDLSKFVDLPLDTTANKLLYDTQFIGVSPVPSPLYSTTINAVQVTIRVWDDKTKQARQITVAQDM